MKSVTTLLGFLLLALPALAQRYSFDPSVGNVRAVSINGSTVLVGTSAGGIFRSADGGVTFKPTSLNRGHIWALLQTPAAAYAGAEGGLWRSTDGGATWQQVALTHTHVYDLDYDPANGVAYAATWGGGLYRKRDSETTWQPINTGLPADAVGGLEIMTHPATATVIASIYGYGMYRSTAVGTQWESAATDIATPYAYALAATTTRAFAGTWGDGVWRSENFGQTWMRSGLAGLHVYDLASNTEGYNRGIIYAATNDGIYRTTDNGATWNSFARKGEAVFSLAVTDAGQVGAGMAAAVAVQGVSATPAEDEVPVAFTIGAPYPNPLHSGQELHLPVTLTEATSVSATLQDVLGREVAHVAPQVRSIGTSTLQLGVEGLAPGLYLYRVRIGKDEVVRKVIVR